MLAFSAVKSQERREKTTPVGVNSVTNQILFRATQGGSAVQAMCKFLRRLFFLSGMTKDV